MKRHIAVKETEYAAINNDWLDALKGEFKKPYYKKLFNKVNEEYRTEAYLSAGR